MPIVTSPDGTRIAYEKAGSGPAIVLVDGALCWRAAGITPSLLPVLAEHFTVFAYDRRGRGESDGAADAVALAANRTPVDIDRELDDLQAVIDVAGGDPYVCGFSSGAVLAMYAVERGARPRKLVLFEAPVTVVDETDEPFPEDATTQLQQMVAEDRRGDAVTYFMRTLIGVPAFVMVLMKTVMRKGWNSTRKVAHTLPYDISLLQHTGGRVPTEAAGSITIPTLVIGGGKSPEKLKKAVAATAAAIPGAEVREIPGQTHMVKPKPFTAALVEWLGAE